MKAQEIQERLKTLLPQPLIAIASALGAVSCLAAAWNLSPVLGAQERAPSALLGIFLCVSVVLAYQFPIHVLPNTKIHVSTVGVYLIAVMLHPQIAASVAALAVGGGNLLTRRKRGLYLSDVVTDASRISLVVLAASVLAHISVPHPPLIGLPLIVAAATLWSGDILTGPLLLSPITGDSPRLVITAMLRGGGLAEAAQYLVALLGALAATYQWWALLLLPLPVAMVHRSLKSAKEVRQSTRQILEGMADAVDLRDPYTGGHSRRVAELTTAILKALPMLGPETDLIVSSARVHDIGKIGMPDAVLKKEGALTDEEWLLMKAHPIKGADLLRKYPDFARGVGIIRHHHERWDGGGYPDGIKMKSIPLGARVIAVADSFDAMTSDRPYREGMPVEKALQVLRRGRGEQWDPRIVDAFLTSLGAPTEELLMENATLVKAIA